MTRRHDRDWGIAVKACAGLTGLLLAAAAAAYAATAPRGEHRLADRALGHVLRERTPQGPSGGPSAAPRILARPPAVTVSAAAVFRFASSGRAGASQCRLDRGAWAGCRSPIAYASLAVGGHTFRVRSSAPGLGPGAAARYSWLRAAPRPFRVAPVSPRLGLLYPGAAPVQIPLLVANPNSAPIVITRLRVGIAHDPAGCDSASNLKLAQPNVSLRRPLPVGAGKRVRLPTPKFLAPTIQLRNLPVNQDACQRATFRLTFSGSAHG
jgi:hypothetical protein